MLATLIDHAEPTGGSGTDEFWIVLEDLHNAHPDHAAELLAALARHARASRWIAVGRERLESEEARGQSLALGPMSEPELRELAAALAPEASALVQHAAGLPGRLLQLSTGESPADPLHDEDEAARRLVESLSLVNALVPAPVLARRCADVDLGRLLRRGWLTRDSRGVGVHAPMRGLVLAGLSEAARQRAGTDAAGLLGAVDDDPTATLEALGLLLERGDVSSAAGLLEQRTDALLAAGKATELWARLEPVRAPQLASIRLRVAVTVGSGTALGSVTLPADPTPRRSRTLRPRPTARRQAGRRGARGVGRRAGSPRGRG